MKNASLGVFAGIFAGIILGISGTLFVQAVASEPKEDREVAQEADRAHTPTPQQQAEIDGSRTGLEAILDTGEARGNIYIVRGYPELHPGYDITADNKSAKLLSLIEGKVVTAIRDEWMDPGYGHFVVVERADGLQVLYANMDEVFVNVDDEVVRGQALGTMGPETSGRSTGPHVHLEVRVNGLVKNPADYFEELTSAAVRGEIKMEE